MPPETSRLSKPANVRVERGNPPSNRWDRPSESGNQCRPKSHFPAAKEGSLVGQPRWSRVGMTPWKSKIRHSKGRTDIFPNPDRARLEKVDSDPAKLFV